MEKEQKKKKGVWKKIRDKLVGWFIKTAMILTPLSSTASTPTTNSGRPAEGGNGHLTEVTTTSPVSSTKNTYVVSPENMQEELVENLMTSRKNVAGNFDLSGREWTTDELQMIGQSELNAKIVDTAQENAKRSRPKAGQQTYCLGAVKGFFSENGIVIDAQRFAYKAVAGLQKNEHFVELENIAIKEFPSLPDGALMAWEKGSTRYGHIAMKVGTKEYCDFVYNLRSHNRRGSSGQRYGKPHIFILKDMPLSAELTKKLVAEGRLKDSIEKQTLAMIEIGKTRMLLTQNTLKTVMTDLEKITPEQLTLKDLKKNNQRYSQFTSNVFRNRRQKSMN